MSEELPGRGGGGGSCDTTQQVESSAAAVEGAGFRSSGGEQGLEAAGCAGFRAARWGDRGW